MAQKRILAILGSPKKDGTLAQMLHMAVQRAKVAGHHVDMVDLYEIDLKYCVGCMACRKTGKCRLQDDGQRLRELLIQCDEVILAAPTYLANVPAPVKNMFDRLIGAVLDDESSIIPQARLSEKQEYLLMTACSTPAPFDRFMGQSTGAIRAMKAFFKASGMTCKGVIICSGTKDTGVLPELVIDKIEQYVY